VAEERRWQVVYQIAASLNDVGQISASGGRRFERCLCAEGASPLPKNNRIYSAVSFYFNN
jgi:hypothetical protein